MIALKVWPLFISILLFSLGATGMPSPEDESWIEKGGDEIEEWVDDLSTKIDVTLAGKKYKKVKKNPSKAVLTDTLTWREGGKLDHNFDFAINLRLPNLERRWQLRFTSYDDQSEQRRRISPYQALRREKQYGAAVGVVRELGHFKVSLLPRLVLRDPLELNYVLRFERSADFSILHIRHRADLYADANKGTGEFYEITFDWDFKTWSITNNHQEEYRQRDHLFTTAHGLTFEYMLTDESGLYQTSTFSFKNQEAYHLDSMTYGTGYSRILKRDRLKFSLGPALTFSKSGHFKGEASSSLILTLTF